MCKQTQRDEANALIAEFQANGGKVIGCKTGRRNWTPADINAATRDAA